MTLPFEVSHDVLEMLVAGRWLDWDGSEDRTAVTDAIERMLTRSAWDHRTSFSRYRISEGCFPGIKNGSPEPP